MIPCVSLTETSVLGNMKERVKDMRVFGCRLNFWHNNDKDCQPKQEKIEPELETGERRLCPKTIRYLNRIYEKVEMFYQRVIIKNTLKDSAYTLGMCKCCTMQKKQ